ncbi:MAG TPA: nucleoside triphosphate pyrophosphatase [Opitutales bacterium]|nr:nucleoside triphosphate pyrophosphatase [Opitutales bacterium]
MIANFILASGSPRRRKILADAGYAFTVVKTDAAEVSVPHAPRRTVTANADLKLEACRKAHPGATILAADTIVWFNGKIYGKPKDRAEAKQFLHELSGHTHTVFTGLAFCRAGGRIESAVATSDVAFKKLSDTVIDDYVARTNPLDRAGAYDIDENGGLIVASYAGSYENIMGLPLEPVRAWLG